MSPSRRSLKPEDRRCECWCACRCARCSTSTSRNVGQDYLDIGRVGPALQHAARIWVGDNIAIQEEGRNVGDGQIAAVRVSLPSDRSFASYDEAMAHLTGPPLPDATDMAWNQAAAGRAARISDSSRSARSSRSSPAFGRLAIRVVTVLRFVSGPTAPCARSSTPAIRVWCTLDPRWHQAAWTFVKLGCRAHPRRRRSPAVRVLPGDPVAPNPAADPGGDLLHRRSFDHAARGCRRAHAGRVVVSAARSRC